MVYFCIKCKSWDLIEFNLVYLGFRDKKNLNGSLLSFKWCDVN